jgi:hypothetical protein
MVGYVDGEREEEEDDDSVSSVKIKVSWAVRRC